MLLGPFQCVALELENRRVAIALGHPSMAVRRLGLSGGFGAVWRANSVDNVEVADDEKSSARLKQHEAKCFEFLTLLSEWLAEERI